MRVRLALAGETRAPAKVAARSAAPVANSAAPAAPAPHVVSAPPSSQNGHGPAAAPPMPSAVQQNGHAASANGAAASRPTAVQPAPSQQALEAEVRADPVVREILKTGAVELAEVRPLLGDEA